MENKNPNLTRAYRDKADHYFHAMQLTSDDVEHYSAAVALLAVHTAITLNDAIVAGVTGRIQRHHEHQAAVSELKKVCTTTRVPNTRGVAQLEWLLSRKTEIAYSSTRVDSQYAQNAQIRAERFTAWAYEAFKEVLRATT